MPNQKITLKADDFKYPSSDERRTALRNYAQFKFFEFNHVSELDMVLSQSVQMPDAVRKSSLHWWGNVLKNRFGKLQETYVYALTCYNRKFPDNLSKCSQEEAVNNILFEYYVEIFFYHFFAIRDGILQILNVYYCLPLKENEVRYKNISAGINDLTVKTHLKSFKQATKITSDFRNSFTHKFPPTEIDHRSTYYEIDGRNILEINQKEGMTSDEIVALIALSLISLETLMNELVKIVK